MTILTYSTDVERERLMRDHHLNGTLAAMWRRRGHIA